MKAKLSSILALAFLAVSSLCQTVDPSQYVLVLDSLGQPTNVPLSLVEAANGLGETNSEHQLAPQVIRADTEGAVGDYGALNVRFTPNVAESRPVSITTRDGRAIAFRPTYILLVKRSTQETWVVGQITNSVLHVSPSEVLYRGAFDTISADLRYKYADNGSKLEQFVTLRQGIVLPRELQDSEADLALECWTEFFLENEPISVQETAVLLRTAQPGVPAVQAQDQSMDLGSVRIPGGGTAFELASEEETMPVVKSWLVLEDARTATNDAPRARRFLCERVDWLSIRPKLDRLPKSRGQASLIKDRKSSRSLLARLAPPPAVAHKNSGRVVVARDLPAADSGLVIDFMVAAPPGIVAWWKGDGTALDIIGGHDGTSAPGGIGYAGAMVGQGFSFDGADDWVSVDQAAPLNFGPGADFTIEGWINPIAATTSYDVQIIVDKRVTNPQDNGAVGYALYLVNGRLGCQLAEVPLAAYNYLAYGPAGPDLRGNYHHIAMTVDRDFTSGGVLYVDGIPVGTFNPTSELGDLSDAPLRIGKHATDGINSPFKGIIDELSIYNRVLSPAEIQSIFNAGADGKAVPPTITTQPVSQSMAAGDIVTFTVTATGSAPLSYQWRLNGQDICGATTSAYIRYNVQPSNQGNYSVMVNNLGGSVASVDAALTVSGSGAWCVAAPSGLVSWWGAECDAADATATSPGTLMNGAGFGAGEVGQGFRLNGASRYVRVPNNTSLQLATEFTIECWYKDTGSSSTYGLVAKRSATSPYTTTYGINIWPGHVLQVYFLDPVYGGGFKICDYSAVPTANVFHHIAGTFKQINSSQVELKAYIDGVCVKTVTKPGNLANCQNSVPVTIGASTEGAEYLVGLIDEVSIYNRALSDAEILGIYNANAAGKCATQQIATPAFSPPGGVYAAAQTVAISCATPGSVIRYTTDGQEPTTTSAIYVSPISISQNLTLKAKAWYGTWTPSDIEAEAYRVDGTGHPPTITVSPPTGTSLLASEDFEILVEAADSDGSVTKVELLHDGVKVASSSTSPLRYTLSKVFAGTYTFTARAIDIDGFVTVSSAVVYTVNASGPAVSLHGQNAMFTTSPGTLLASVYGVNPGTLTTLTLNGTPLSLQTGDFTITAGLVEGDNPFTLAAVDNQSRSQQASTSVSLDSILPTITITAPASGASFGTTRINVSGTFTETFLKRITVNGVLAFVSGSAWEALNVPLAAGANTITATAEDISGNTGTSTITVTGGSSPVDPVQLDATPVGGFVSLQVTFTPHSTAPGTLQQVLFDFNGDSIVDQTAANLNPITHTYTSAGEYFPVVTVVTSLGKFSSSGGWSAFGDRLRINVQAPPVVPSGSTIVVSSPVDLKWMPGNHLYVLSSPAGGPPTVTEYNVASAPAIERTASVGGIGDGATGLDVDSNGNVYVAVSTANKVKKFKPDNPDSFTLDPTFGSGGVIGGAGSGDGQFNSPFDVAVTPGGAQIAISDAGNNRIQRFSNTGAFLGSMGEYGTGLEQLSSPKGIAYDQQGRFFIADSENARLALGSGSGINATVGQDGNALGTFHLPLNVAATDRGIYVADTGNNRIQVFDAENLDCEFFGGVPLNPRIALSSIPGLSPGLSAPASISPVEDSLQERLYIADTGNNRVVLVSLPGSTPEVVWNTMKQLVLAGDLAGASACFSALTADRYLNAFKTIGTSALGGAFQNIPNISPLYIKSELAEYYLEDVIDGETFAFPIDFIKENGAWKILEF